MIIELKNNLQLKKYFKKPIFLLVKDKNNYLNLLINNKIDLFLKKINTKKLNSERIFHLYFYLEYILESKEKHSDFLTNFVYRKLESNYMYILYEGLIDKEICDFLHKHSELLNKLYLSDKNIIIVDKEIIQLLKLYEKLHNSNKKTINLNANKFTIFINSLRKKGKISEKNKDCILYYLNKEVQNILELNKK